MMLGYFCLVLFTSFVVAASYIQEGALYYKNSWIVEVPDGLGTAKSIALQMGFVFINPVWLFENHFIFLRKDFPLRQRLGSRFVTELLLSNKEVSWAEQQFVRERVKKAFNDPRVSEAIARPISKHMVHLENEPIPRSTKYGALLENVLSWLESSRADDGSAETQSGLRWIGTEVSKYLNYFDDPMWKKQWYALRSSLDQSGLGSGMSLMEVYKMNITGLGVRVAIVDDGVDVAHPDLRQNYDAEYSFDLNHNRSDVRPWFESDGQTRFTHGTKCAGVVAMAANNGQCGVGVAYNAKLAVIKMLEQPGVDVVEGQALRYKCEGIHIFSNSWGPGDSGRIMENMGTMSGKAIEKCLQIGRSGKGSIYLFPAGNGKWRGDNCGADAYSNSLYIITIASATRRGKVTNYSERCSAIFATTYSGGDPDNQEVVATSPNNTCHNHFSSTSASVPMASGIVALALQANGNLTYRDVKHLIAMSSEVAPLAGNRNTWKRNGAGFWVSMDFGFGLINAKKMVELAQSWKTVPQSRKCTVSVYFRKSVIVKPGQLLEVIINTSACSGTSNEVLYLEQLQVVPFIPFGCRGTISIHLTSPTGTTSTLLETRENDLSLDGLVGWPLKSVHFWGENPSGVWMLQTKIHPHHKFQSLSGKVKGFLLIFSGTYEKPHHYNTLPRKYTTFTVQD